MQLFWQEHPGQGPYMLLVHGMLSSASQWHQNLRALGQVCRPVTVELWGHHRSPTPENSRSYEPAAYVEQFESIRHQLGCEQWLVCGYSLGAGLTIAYSLAHPDRVLAHAFTNSSSALADASQQAQWRAEAPAIASRLAQKGVAALAKIPVHPQHARRLPADTKALLVQDALTHNPLGIANTLLHTNPLTSVRERLAHNVRPCLLLCGHREKRFAPHLAYVQEVMPALQVALLDAGHGVNMEDAQGFNVALTSFIGEHGA